MLGFCGALTGVSGSKTGIFKFSDSENAFFPGFDLVEAGDLGSFASVPSIETFMVGFMLGNFTPAFGVFSSDTDGSYAPKSVDWCLRATLGTSTVLLVLIAPLSRRLPCLPFLAIGDPTLLFIEG